MRQLGSAILALVVMLVCAAISDRFVPAVASGETALASSASSSGGNRVVTSRAVEVTRLGTVESRNLPPPVPEPFVLLVAGVVLMGLGGALRTRRREE